MNKFVKPLALTMVLTIPETTSADIETNQVNEAEVRISHTNKDTTF